MNSTSLSPRVGGIYAIVNTLNGHLYIGSTVDFGVRRYNHFWALRVGKHNSPILQRAYAKYGETAFSFRPLEECDQEHLLEREQFYIDSVCPAYNTGTCADNGRRGVKSSPEHCARISASNMGRVSPMKGKRQTAEHTRKRVEAMRGKPRRTGWHHPPITCAKLSAIRKERRDYIANLHTPEARARAAASAIRTIRKRRPDKTAPCQICSTDITYRGKRIPKACGYACRSELRRRRIQRDPLTGKLKGTK